MFKSIFALLPVLALGVLADGVTIPGRIVSITANRGVDIYGWTEESAALGAEIYRPPGGLDLAFKVDKDGNLLGNTNKFKVKLRKTGMIVDVSRPVSLYCPACFSVPSARFCQMYSHVLDRLYYSDMPDETVQARGQVDKGGRDRCLAAAVYAVRQAGIPGAVWLVQWSP